MRLPFIRRAFLFAALLLASSVHAARQDGLVLYMNFDDKSDTLKVTTTTGQPEGLILTKVGRAVEMQFTAGKFGRAALFKNTPAQSANDCALSLGKIDSLYGENFTVGFWLKPSVTTQNAVLFSNKTATGREPGLALIYSQNQITLSPGGSAPVTSSAAAITPGDWHYITLVVNRSRSTATCFADGKEVVSADIQPTANFSTGLATVIGAAANAQSGLNGAVDEIAFWNRAVTPKEIETIAVGKRVPESSGLVWVGAAAGIAGVAAIRRRRKTR